MNIMYLSFGTNQAIYLQTLFSIQSLWAHHTDVAVHVVTDHPEYFGGLMGHVNLSVREMTAGMLAQWTRAGDVDYFYRIKLKIVEQFIAEHPGAPLLFLDSDTFVYRPLGELAEALGAGKALMHEPEKRFSDANSKTEKNVWGSIRGATIEGVVVTDRMVGWNSGVIGIPAKDNAVAVKHALSICDDLCHRIRRRNFVEQIAYSMALSHRYELMPASGCIAHYWGNKEEWNAAISRFYLDCKMKGLSFDQEQELIRRFDFSALAYRKRPSNTRERLVRLIDKMFPDKDYLFLKQE